MHAQRTQVNPRVTDNVIPEKGKAKEAGAHQLAPGICYTPHGQRGTRDYSRQRCYEARPWLFFFSFFFLLHLFPFATRSSRLSLDSAESFPFIRVESVCTRSKHAGELVLAPRGYYATCATPQSTVCCVSRFAFPRLDRDIAPRDAAITRFARAFIYRVSRTYSSWLDPAIARWKGKSISFEPRFRRNLFEM